VVPSGGEIGTKKMITKQEAINKVWDTFITKEASPSVKNGSAVYGSPETTGCAIACLLTREERIDAHEWEMDSTVSNKTVSCLIESLSIPTLNKQDVEFYTILQRAHDDIAGEIIFHYLLKIKLKIIAERYNLAIPTT
jgi:hypothetical protein